jgi:outer membrane beta-barrel protein
MIQARVGLLIMAALMATPGLAQAQGKGKKPGPAEAAKPAEGAKDGTASGDAPAGGDKAGEKPATPTEGSGGTEPEGPSICEMDPSQCPNIDIGAMAKRPIPAQMYAVQQKYALRVRRVEVNPYYSFTLNDQFVSHPGPGLAINYYITDVLAIGVNGNAYNLDFINKDWNLNSEQAFNAQTRRAARIGVPLTEYNWSAALNMTYVPMYGKFAGFNYFIFHYDFYVVGGVGLLSNRPIAVIDPDNRTFDSKTNLAFNAGLGLRVFFNRWLAGILEVRDYAFFDQLENTKNLSEIKDPKNKSEWYSSDTTFTNHVQAQIGLSIFLPFSFEYSLPK